MEGKKTLATSDGLTHSSDGGAARVGSRWFLLVVAAFIAALLTSNIIAVRIVTLGDAPVVGGTDCHVGDRCFPLELHRWGCADGGVWVRRRPSSHLGGVLARTS